MRKETILRDQEERGESQSEELQVGIGVRIKHFRKMRHLKLEDVAKKTEIPKSTISQIENGNMSPSVAQLLKFAEALEVNFAALFPREFVAFPQEHRFADEFAILRKEHRRTSVSPQADAHAVGSAHDLLMTFMPAGAAQLFAVTIPQTPQAEVAFHRHAGMELAYIVHGDITFVARSGEQVFDTALHSGDVLCFPARYAHAYNAIGRPAALIGLFYLTEWQKVSEVDDAKVD